MPAHPLRVTLVNMGRHNEGFHTFLQTSSADVVLFQEPWFGRIGVQCSDTDHEGVEVLDATYNDKWMFFLPPHSPTEWCKVAIYVHRHLVTHL